MGRLQLGFMGRNLYLFETTCIKFCQYYVLQIIDMTDEYSNQSYTCKLGINNQITLNKMPKYCAFIHLQKKYIAAGKIKVNGEVITEEYKFKHNDLVTSVSHRYILLNYYEMVHLLPQVIGPLVKAYWFEFHFVFNTCILIQPTFLYVLKTLNTSMLWSIRMFRHEMPVTAQPIEILVDTPDILVVNKPASIPMHPCGRFRHNSLLFIMAKELNLHNLRRQTSFSTCLSFIEWDFK